MLLHLLRRRSAKFHEINSHHDQRDLYFPVGIHQALRICDPHHPVGLFRAYQRGRAGASFAKARCVSYFHLQIGRAAIVCIFRIRTISARPQANSAFSISIHYRAGVYQFARSRNCTIPLWRWLVGARLRPHFLRWTLGVLCPEVPHLCR